MAWRYRRFLLAILAVILLARTVEWYLPNEPEPDERETISGEQFVQQLYFESVSLVSQQDELLSFEGSNDIWTFRGEQVLDFSRHVTGFEVGPHGSSPFVMIRLPEDASADTYRRALWSLARHGICRVGVASPAPDQELKPEPYRQETLVVEVYKVVRYTPDNLPPQVCTNRFLTWNS
jgi:hypothetical protein